MAQPDLFMRNRKNKGMTLIELVITMVVLGVGLSGILSVMIVIAKNSASPQISWQSAILGENVIQILMSKSYDLSGVCLSKNDKSYESLCDYAKIQNEKITDVFPELMKNLKDYAAFKISIDIQPYHGMSKDAESALISVKIMHSELGETHFAAVKTRDTQSNEKGMRFYTY